MKEEIKEEIKEEDELKEVESLTSHKLIPNKKPFNRDCIDEWVKKQKNKKVYPNISGGKKDGKE